MSTKLYLFSYGSLQQPEVQLSLYKRVLIGKEDQLKGYKLAEELLYFQYPIIFETKKKPMLFQELFLKLHWKN